MLGNIVKLFEWPLVRKQLYKYSPFTILPVAIKGARNEKDYRIVPHTFNCCLASYLHPILSGNQPCSPDPSSPLFLPVGVNMFYICIIVYLYGDLAIYAAAVPISLMEVAW